MLMPRDATRRRSGHPDSTPSPHACATFGPVACCGLIFLPSLLNRTLGGGARLRRPSRERTLMRVESALAQYLEELQICIPYNLAVDGARHAVLQLQVHLRKRILGEDRGI